MELNVIESKGTSINTPPSPPALLKEVKEEKADCLAKTLDFYLDFMDPERESQW